MFYVSWEGFLSTEICVDFQCHLSAGLASCKSLSRFSLSPLGLFVFASDIVMPEKGDPNSIGIPRHIKRLGNDCTGRR